MVLIPSRRLGASLAVLAAALCLAPVASAQESTPAPVVPQADPAAPPSVPAEPPSEPAVVPDPEAVPPEAAEVATAPAEPAIPPIPEVWSPVPRDAEGRSAYGLYLAGKVALIQGEGATGADYMARAEVLTPEQPTLRRQAFTASVMAGDLDVAARVAPRAGEDQPLMVEAGRLVQVVQQLAHGDARAANAELAAHPIGSPHARAGQLLAPWVAAAAGDWTRALAEPPANLDPVSLAFARQNRAALLERRGRLPEAEAQVKALAEQPGTGMLFRIPYGEFLERRGRRDEALALYDAAVAAGQDDIPIQQARERVRAGGRAPAAPDINTGAALALTAAAAQASVERANELSVVYLRLAIGLDRDPEALYRLGQALSRAGLLPAARTALEEIGPEDRLLYAAARLQLGLSHQAAGDSDKALVELKAAQQAAPEDATVARVLAGQLISMRRYDEALALLDGPVLNTPASLALIEVRFLRGAALESLGRLPEAEAELWAALQTQPDNPTVLNYLGYMWVDKEMRIAEGAEMIARAHAAQPDNGNIQDSLGWAQYRQGNYAAAVETLEEAVGKEPANAEINDHLGDAYWRVGRRREAGFQWARVLTLDPDAEQRAAVERKIAGGLGEASAPQPTAQP